MNLKNVVLLVTCIFSSIVCMDQPVQTPTKYILKISQIGASSRDYHFFERTGDDERLLGVASFDQEIPGFLIVEYQDPACKEIVDGAIENLVMPRLKIAS